MELLNLHEEGKVAFIGFEEEMGENKTPHLQGFLYNHSVKGLHQMKELIPRAHFEPKRGTDDQNMKYCSKEGKFMCFGELPRQGHRSDIEEFINEMKKEPDFKKLVLKYPRHCLRMMKNARELHAMYHEPDDSFEKPKVQIIWGTTGVGKSRAARKYFQDKGMAYFCKDASMEKWWNGYRGQPGVILDEFRGGQMKFHELLKLLDGYGSRQQTKGGDIVVKPKEIIITCDNNPRDWYQTFGNDENNWAQLERRVNEGGGQIFNMVA